jgi:hypothetical protein
MPFTKHYRNSVLTRTSLTNLVANGDASDGTTEWTGSNATLSASSNTLSVTGNGGSAAPRVLGYTGAATIGNKYYVKARIRVTNNSCTLIRTHLGGVWATVVSSPTANEWYPAGVVINASSVYAYTIFDHSYADAATANGKVMEVQYVLAIDLTAQFGAGNEPTTTKMSADLLHYAPVTSWFDGTASVSTTYTDGILTHDDWETFNNKQSTPLEGSVVWNPASLADGAGETSAAITVTGAALGDLVVVGPGVDTQGMMVFGWVSAADTVYIRLQNESGGTLDLASSTWNVRVFAQ